MTDDARLPAVRASDAEREALVARLQTAVGEGRLDLDEFAQRAEAAYAAVTTADLERLVTDLPSPREIVGMRVPESLREIWDDVRLAGSHLPPRRITAVFGDVRIDLRGLRTDRAEVELHLTSTFGDVEVIVSEGVDALLEGSTVFGSRKVQLAPVPRISGTPRVTVRARSVFGDLRLRTLAPGESPSRWRAVLGRLDRGGGTPPPRS
ncbi:DUF1707 domain-containing protein [Blastococcus sp. LR1]|uniref:DUF1707 SHOCT-like domain-containing protein n=1 Tax=Blastococcus sp. LR1 TaxID=2877000 RepID=UPI001CCE730B|nr:DUF1707 domain-containing protein [Blastococcus sp. LR1]MCA0144459.1 DUF1707 domain-containing protein [Blastococcus sp. LR1]